MDIVERFPSISPVLTAPTPLEHFSNIIKMSKVGQNSSPYHELCGDFKDNSIKAKETLNMHAMSIFAPSPCIHGILTQELRLIMYLEVWWGLMYDLLTKSYNHIHKLMGLGLHVLHHLMLRISHIYIYSHIWQSDIDINMSMYVHPRATMLCIWAWKLNYNHGVYLASWLVYICISWVVSRGFIMWRYWILNNFSFIINRYIKSELPCRPLAH